VVDVDPAGARSSAEFVLLLGQRRQAAGLSYRQLAGRARLTAQSLPPSTVATMLNRSTLPARDLVATYIRACGGDDADVAAWLAARARIASAGIRRPEQAVPDPCGAAIGAALVAPTPRQLPPGPADFVGRQAQLAELDAAMAGHCSTLAVVAGPPGVGKTALAVHWARSAWGRFPDGQLYVDLHGRGPGEPLPAVAALAHVLVGLGVPMGGIPTDEQQAAALFRSVVADRRILLLLDGAASADQVRPLRPSGPGACTVVTSRDSLVGLTVHDGARVINVPPLERRCALLLLAQSASHGLVMAEPTSAEVLVELCGRLPLAVRLAAAALDRCAVTPIADLVAQMRVSGRLGALGMPDDPRACLATAFRDAYAALEGAQQRLFRLFGALPMNEVTAEDAAKALPTTIGHARTLLRRLAEGHLVSRLAGGRYAMPELLREYAGQLAQEADPADTCQAAASHACELARSAHLSSRLLAEHPHPPVAHQHGSAVAVEGGGCCIFHTTRLDSTPSA